MRTVLRGLRLPALLLALLLAVSVGPGVFRSTAGVQIGHDPIEAGFTIGADQSSVGAAVGGQAMVAVTATPFGSFSGLVHWSVSGLPANSAALFLPTTTLPGIPSILAITTGPTVKSGKYPITITATGGGVTRSMTIELVVTHLTGFFLEVDPASRTVINGDTTTYTVKVHRGLLTGPISFGSVGGLPANTTATISPSLVTILTKKVTVTVKTKTSTPSGTYQLKIKGSALLDNDTVKPYLIVKPQVVGPFTLSGDADRLLTPGGPYGAVDVKITNPHPSMTVTNLHTSMGTVSPSDCAADNFVLTDYSGPATLTVPANSSRTLSQLGVPRAQWPRIQMVNKPINQDECKNHTITLHHTADGGGN